MAEDRKKTEFTGIEWTDRSWNPVTGCDKISAGCKFCYAETLAKRLHAMGNPRYTNGFEVTLHADKVTEPLSWRKPGEWVFVNSMSDLLHKDVPDAFVLDCVETMARRAPWLRYQWLTKRHDRWPVMSRLIMDRYGAWPRNILPGVSVENKRALERIDRLGEVGDDFTVRKLSIEPLLESLCDGDVYALAERFRRNRIGWVISGGEAGFHARPASLDWFREVRDACILADIPFFHKQHGGPGVTKEVKRGGKLAVLDGVLWHEMPVVWHAERARSLPAYGGGQGALLTA